MAWTIPYFSAGLDIANCNFQLPGDASGLAAGWTQNEWPASSGAWGNTGIMSRLGRPREQFVQMPTAGTLSILSPPSRPLQLVPSTTCKVFAVLDYFQALTGTTVSIVIVPYNSSGAAIGASEVTIATHTGAYNGLLAEAPTSFPVPATCYYVKICVRIVNPVATANTIGMTFAGMGVWNGDTSGYFQTTRYPIMPGSGYRISHPFSNRQRNEAGRVRVLDRSRNAPQAMVTLAYARMPNSDRVLFEKLHALNNGTNWDGYYSVSNPCGGAWPILLLPGMTGMPSAMLCDLTSGLALDPDEEWGRTDPPFWQGALEFTERT